jgi:conserved oligomeric Golgi complex subunit 3
LKHHILAFDIEFAESDVRVDFTSSLWDIRDGLLNPAKLVRALGGGFVPRVITDMKDARTEVDERLRVVIGDLVSGWSARVIAPISDALTKSNGEEKRGRTDSRKGSTSRDDATAALRVREAVQRDVPLIRRKLDEYIHDSRTRDMLLRAVLEDVLIKYAAWLEKRGLGSPGVSKGKAKGKGREDGVWEEDVFGEWAVGAFGLGDVGEDEED